MSSILDQAHIDDIPRFINNSIRDRRIPHFHDIIIDTTTKPSPPLVYTAQARLLADDYRRLLRYPDLRLVIEDVNDEDEYDTWQDKKPPPFI